MSAPSRDGWHTVKLPAGIAKSSAWITTAKARIASVLGRHVREEDAALSDRAFVEALYERWRRELAVEIVDVGE